MKKLVLLLLCLVMALLPLTSLAGAALERSIALEKSITLNRAYPTYTVYKSGAYYLYDLQGNALGSPYGSMSSHNRGQFFSVQNENILNGEGIIDATGKLVVPMQYGDTAVLSANWLLGFVLAPTTDDVGEYKDNNGNKYNIDHTDVYYAGQLLTTLSRDDLKKEFYYGTTGDFMFVRRASGVGYWLNSKGERVEVTKDFSTSEYLEVYKKGVFHNPTQQWAFTATCTLTPDQVVKSVIYDDNGNFVDLQGNIISQGPTAYQEYNHTYYPGGNYMRVSANSGYGVASLDGKEIIPPFYKDIQYDYNHGYFSSGYQGALDDKGRLSFFDVNGNVTASVDYELSSSDYKGFGNGAPMVAVNNMGKYIIITATQGELPTRYEDVKAPSGAHRIMSVKQNGLWGVIDLDGNVVIPFVHNYNLEISDDGTYAYGVTEDRTPMLYFLSYTDAAPAVTAAPPAEPAAEPTAAPAVPASEWYCTECGTKNAGKFCVECGTAKPAIAAEQKCTNCGFDPEGSTPKFCPECGTKF